jgi:hypothetical protein
MSERLGDSMVLYKEFFVFVLGALVAPTEMVVGWRR